MLSPIPFFIYYLKMPVLRTYRSGYRHMAVQLLITWEGAAAILELYINTFTICRFVSGHIQREKSQVHRAVQDFSMKLMGKMTIRIVNSFCNSSLIRGFSNYTNLKGIGEYK